MISWLYALAGGALIGLAASGLLLINGRIAGISGILGGAASAQPGLWRWAFLAGLIAAGFLAPVLGFGRVGSPTGVIPADLPVLAAAGGLVGFGTTLSSGCTSGHGVCGISNLSLRSITATLIFMATAAAAVFAVRQGAI